MVTRATSVRTGGEGSALPMTIDHFAITEECVRSTPKAQSQCSGWKDRAFDTIKRLMLAIRIQWSRKILTGGCGSRRDVRVSTAWSAPVRAQTESQSVQPGNGDGTDTHLYRPAVDSKGFSAAIGSHERELTANRLCHGGLAVASGSGRGALVSGQWLDGLHCGSIHSSGPSARCCASASAPTATSTRPE